MRARSLGMLFLTVLVAAGAVAHATHDHADAFNTLLQAVILLIAAATLGLTWPRPAKLLVMRAEELELDDLVFFISEPDSDEDGLRLPLGYLLQLHVAVGNLGDRKAVLSRLAIDDFVDATGRVVSLPGGRADGMKWVRRSGYTGVFAQMSERIAEHPPYILDRDEVIIAQFRQRRGPIWDPTQPADPLRLWWDSLREPLATANVRLVWRRGREVRTSIFAIPVRAVQQAEFASQLRVLTHEFTSQPTSAPRPQPSQDA